MRKPETTRFKATLLRPATPKGATWSFLILPAVASAKLPARGPVTVDGKVNGQPFQTTLAPDGQGSHWLKVPRALREALAAKPQARAPWTSLTPVARRDWIHWITSAKKPETRERRIAHTCDMLASGKRRVCCFDRSGMYSKGLGAPEAVGVIKPHSRKGQ